MPSSSNERDDRAERREIIALVRELRAENARLSAELSALRARQEEARTPNICGHRDSVYYAEDDFDGAADYPNELYRLDWANRSLDGDWYAVRIVTAWDDEGGVDESEIQLFPSKDLAEAAIAKSAASRALQENDR